jgi:hypothetical protein
MNALRGSGKGLLHSLGPTAKRYLMLRVPSRGRLFSLHPDSGESPFESAVLVYLLATEYYYK